MRNKLLYAAITLTALMLISLAPVASFIYPNATTDKEYEYYGPHADVLQMKMYLGEPAMWTALSLGQIDLTDWPLTTTWRTQPPPNGFNGDPNVNVVSAGGEAGFYTVDFNYFKYPRLGNPPGSPPNRANPVYTVIPGYSKSIHGVAGIPPISNNDEFRIGVGHLFNRTEFTTYVGAAGVPILTPIPSYMSGWIWAGATPYAYDRTQAEAHFTAGHVLQDKTVMPWVRYYDYNENGIRDTGEDTAAVLVQTWRSDAYRTKAGVMLNTELTAMNFTFRDTGVRTGGTNYQQVMLDKNYHITTLGWINVGPDPDHLYDLYHITAYWDDPSSSCSNTAGLNDTVLNTLAEGVKFAVSAAAALPNAIAWQQRFYAICAQIPLFSNNAFKANRKYYSGGNAETIVSPDDGENIYRRVGGVEAGAKREWLGIANQEGQGSNNFWSLLNMYPNSSMYGTNNKMTIRYGWKEQQYPQHINPFYSEWYWDSIVLGPIYDSLGYRNPYNLAQWKGDLVKTWYAGVWNDGGVSKSKVTLTLRPDVKFHDGRPMTIGDVVFSLVESGQMLQARGYPPPWWWPTGEQVRSLSIIDPYTVEILYNVTSYLAESWTLGGFSIVPKHIWKPIIQSGNPQAEVPDPNLIGSGPYRYLSWVKTSSLVLVANKPGSTVTTDRPGAVATTSPGVRFYDPVHVNIHLKPPFEYDVKVAIPHAVGVAPATHQSVSFAVSLTSWYLDPRNPSPAVPLIVNKYVYIDGVLQPGFPVDVPLLPNVTEVEQFTFDFPKCNHTIKVAIHIKGPTELYPGKPNPWISHWINVTQVIWITIAEDIAGTKFLADFIGWPGLPFKNQVPAPDCRVDMSDVYDAATAFGSNPGHPRWKSHADITHDYRVDMSDIYNIAKMFGKWQ